MAASFDGAADEDFVFAAAVDVGGIEKIDSEIDGAMNRSDGFVVVAARIEFGHAHAAETERGDFESGTAEGAARHVNTGGLGRSCWLSLLRNSKILYKPESSAASFAITDQSLSR